MELPGLRADGMQMLQSWRCRNTPLALGLNSALHLFAPACCLILSSSRAATSGRRVANFKVWNWMSRRSSVSAQNTNATQLPSGSISPPQQQTLLCTVFIPNHIFVPFYFFGWWRASFLSDCFYLHKTLTRFKKVFLVIIFLYWQQICHLN